MVFGRGQASEYDACLFFLAQIWDFCELGRNWFLFNCDYAFVIVFSYTYHIRISVNLEGTGSYLTVTMPLS